MNTKNRLQTMWTRINQNLMVYFMIGLQFLMNPRLALADGTVELPETKIDNASGTVTFDNAGNTDLGNAVERIITGGHRIFGWVIALVGVGLIIIGGFQAYKASKAIQEGNQQGWGDTRNIIVGLIVGGVLFTVIGLMIGFGVGFGNSLFE